MLTLRTPALLFALCAVFASAASANPLSHRAKLCGLALSAYGQGFVGDVPAGAQDRNPFRRAYRYARQLTTITEVAVSAPSFLSEASQANETNDGLARVLSLKALKYGGPYFATNIESHLFTLVGTSDTDPSQLREIAYFLLHTSLNMQLREALLHRVLSHPQVDASVLAAVSSAARDPRVSAHTAIALFERIVTHAAFPSQGSYRSSNRFSQILKNYGRALRLHDEMSIHAASFLNRIVARPSMTADLAAVLLDEFSYWVATANFQGRLDEMDGIAVAFAELSALVERMGLGSNLAVQRDLSDITALLHYAGVR